MKQIKMLVKKITINKDNFITQLKANHVSVKTINVDKDGKPTKNNKVDKKRK